MPLHPQVQQLLSYLEAENLRPADPANPDEARRIASLRRTKVDNHAEAVAKIEDRLIPGPGGEIPIRIYKPYGQEPFPAVVYFHGGGFVLGDLDFQQTSCCAIANATPCVVVSVGYRLAPEHKFPAAAEDCYAATRWVAENASVLGAKPGQCAVCGESAGGNLAAVVCLMARDRGGPSLVFQVLIYPMMDFAFDTASYHDYAAGYLLTKEACVYFWNQYLSKPAEGANPYASPLRAKSLAGLPAAFILLAQYDPLRDEGQAYAQRLKGAGVPVIVRNYEALIHGFWGMGAYLDATRRARQEVAEVLGFAFRTPRATVR